MSATARLDRYLSLLPSGIDSYPECESKASIVREYLRFLPTGALLGKVPRPVEDLITRLPSTSAWIPEVHAYAFYLAVIDLHLGSEAEFLSRSYIANRQLLTSPLYRVMMLFVSPLQLLKNAESRWNTFHRGIQLVTDSLPTEKSGTATFHLTYPKYALPEALAASSTNAIRAAVEVAGGHDVTGQVLGGTPTAAHVSVSWK